MQLSNFRFFRNIRALKSPESPIAIIAFFTRDGLVIFLTFLIARQRIKENVHNLWEVLAGALLGVLFTILVIQLLL